MRSHLLVTNFLLLLTACGGGGGGSSNSGALLPPALPSNESPVVSTANPDQSAVLGQAFDYDTLQGGNTFRDPDGDALSYLLEVTEEPRLHVRSAAGRPDDRSSGPGQQPARVLRV